MLLELFLDNIQIPLNVIRNFKIIENILSPITQGSFELLDTNYINYKNITKREDYQISIKVYDFVKDETKLLYFLVPTINLGKVQDNNMVLIEFESYYSIKLLTNETTKYYNDLNSNIALDILNESDIDINYIKKTSNSFKSSFPYITGFEKLNYLKARMVDEKSRGGYLFFPDLFSQKMNIVNYNGLWSGEIQKYEKVLCYPPKFSDEYVGNCLTLDKLETYNLKEAIVLLNKTFNSYDINSNTIVESDLKIETIINSDKNQYPNLLLNLDKLDNYMVQSFYNRNTTELNELLNTAYYKALNSLYSIKVECNGDYNRRLGALIELVSLKEDGDGLISDNQTSGIYIVKEIIHNISNKSYSQEIILGKNGVLLEESE